MAGPCADAMCRDECGPAGGVGVHGVLQALTAMTDGALTACRKCWRPRKRRPSIVSGGISGAVAVIGRASVERLVVMEMVFLRNRSLGSPQSFVANMCQLFGSKLKVKSSRSHLAHQVVYSWSHSAMTT